MMVHKRYIKRGGKLYGPYFYESFRDENGELIESFVDRIIGRTAREPVLHPESNEIIVDTNEEISEETAHIIEEIGIGGEVICSVW